MTNQEFLQSITDTYSKGIDIIKIKNADYASSTNPFKNFESASVVGVYVKRDILVRVLDKLARVSNLLDKKGEVKDETVEDTITDMINYLAILKARIESENK